MVNKKLQKFIIVSNFNNANFLKGSATLSKSVAGENYEDNAKLFSKKEL